MTLLSLDLLLNVDGSIEEEPAEVISLYDENDDVLELFDDTIEYPQQDLVEQSVFPVRTPDKEGFLGPLSDLLEEEITLPGEEDAMARWVGILH